MTMAQARTQKLPGECCELGEGPFYDLSTDTAWWFDIFGRKLYEHRFPTGDTSAHELPCMASVIARIDDASQLLATEDGLYRRNTSDGSLRLLVPLEAESQRTRSNDGRVHPSGRLWIGTMGKSAEHQVGAIYWSDGHTLQKLFDRITIPNSICFSPDGETAYFADTALNKVWRVATDPRTGLPGSEPELFLSGKDLPLGGSFDGSIVDRDGVIWNAAWGGGSVTGFAPDGTVASTFELPAAQTSCPCFVGTALDRLLVTTAWEGLSEAERTADPGAGFTFVIDGNFRGMKQPDFRLDKKPENPRKDNA
jgi:sugar lactone lactonase YvrE